MHDVTEKALAVSTVREKLAQLGVEPKPMSVDQFGQFFRDDFAETLPEEPKAETASAAEVAAQLNTLPVRQREVLQSIAVESASIKDTARKFAMSEGAVRVALHRALASLTAKLREQ